jgi:hypothetical protein
VPAGPASTIAAAGRARRAGTPPVPQPARATSPSSPTPDSDVADGTRWARCWPWRWPRQVAGARSLAAIGEWAADAPGPVLAALGARRDPLRRAWRPPGEATVRRVLARVDPDALDRAIGAWLAGQQPPSPPTRPPPPPHPRRAVAVDGKTLRGSGHHPNPQVRLLAVMDHTSRAVLGQADVEAATNEIARFRPLLEGLDLRRRGCLQGPHRHHGQPPQPLAIGILRAHGDRTIAAALRRTARDATRPLAFLGITSP